nr:MAG TPA: hypothetical protein [Caudoviricetes sp.]
MLQNNFLIIIFTLHFLFLKPTFQLHQPHQCFFAQIS